MIGATTGSAARSRARHRQRPVMDAQFGSWGTQTLIAGLTADALIAPWVTKGTMDGAAFAASIRNVPVPEMAPRTVVVLDNPAPSQCRSGQRRGVLVSLLSPYFPNRDGICAAQGASKADAAILPSQKRRTADAGGQSRP